jgi:hypothetical protein
MLSRIANQGSGCTGVIKLTLAAASSLGEQSSTKSVASRKAGTELLMDKGTRAVSPTVYDSRHIKESCRLTIQHIVVYCTEFTSCHC